MKLTINKRFTRTFLVLCVLSVVMAVLAALSAVKQARVRVTSLAVVEMPSFSQKSTSIRDYLAFLFLRFLQQEESGSLKVRLLEPSGSRFEVSLDGAGLEATSRLLSETLLRAQELVSAEAKMVLLRKIEEKERELNSLARLGRYKKSVSESSSEGDKLAARLSLVLHTMRLMANHPIKLIRYTKPMARLLPSKDWKAKSVLALGLGLAILLSFMELFLYIGNKRRSQWMIRTNCGTPVIGTIPALAHKFPLQRVSYSQEAEAFRALRTEILCAGFRTLAFTSWGHGEGTSTICANLAMSLAETGKKVLVVDGNMRRPSQHEIFLVSNDLGLSDVLIDTEAQSAFWDAPDSAIKLLVSGPKPPDASVLLSGNRMKEFDRSLQEADVDIILIDTPPLAACSDVLPLSQLAEAVVLVARPGLYKAESVVETARHLRRYGLPLCGLVLNEVEVGQKSRDVYAHRLV